MRLRAHSRAHSPSGRARRPRRRQDPMRPSRDEPPRGRGRRKAGLRARPASSRARRGRGRQGPGRARGYAGSRPQLGRLHAGAFAVVVAGEAHRAVAAYQGDPAVPLRPGDPHRVLHRAPLAGKVRDRGAVRPSLVHAPDAVLAEEYRQDGRRIVRHECYCLACTVSSFFTELTPSTPRATCSARLLFAAVSTAPFKVTTLPSLSTLMPVRVFRPTSAASALFTLVVSQESLDSCLISLVVLPLVPPLLLLFGLRLLEQAARASATATDNVNASAFMKCSFRG